MAKKKTVKPPAVRRTVRNGIVRPNHGVMSMTSENDPFAFNIRGTPTQTQVSFASEQGRRGSEVLGLSTGPSATTIINSAVARRRSRHAVLTNPYAKRAVDIMVSNIVGTGHTMISEAPDPVFKKQVEDLWKLWGEKIDTSNKINFSSFEALALRSMFEGGDCFVRFRVRRPEDNLPVPLQLQLYESEQVPFTKNEMNGLNKIIAGIEFGAIGDTQFYHMYKSHPGELFLLSQNDLTTVLIPASEVLHLHDMRRPNEVRGLPLLSQALIKLSDLDRYMDAELVRKKAASLIGGFIKQPADGTNADNPFITGTEDNSDKQEVHIEAMEPGSFPILPQGYEVSFNTPTDVGPNFKEFLKQQLMMIAASINIMYEQLTGDLAAINDRTLRANMLEFKRIAMTYQKNLLVHQLCRPIFARWFDLAIISGALRIPAGMSETDARKVTWIADPWEYMNPQQEVNTQETEVRAGFKSRSQIITERGGVPEEVDRQMRVDRDREKANDLVYTTNAGVVSNAGVGHSTDPSKILVEEEQQPTGAPTNGE